MLALSLKKIVDFITDKLHSSWMWGYRLGVFGRLWNLRQKDPESEASLDYILRSY